jgi:phosphoglycolate phosphatase
VSTGKKAVIFDLDGTLVDSLDDLAESMNTVLLGQGFPPQPVDAYRLYVGDGVVNLVRRALPPRAAAEPALVERCSRAMREVYAKRWSEKTRPYPGVPDLLRELGRRGIRMAVLTNKPHETAVAVVDHFLGSRTFQAVQGARDGLPRKPDPAGARELLKVLQTRAEAALFVGDTGTDMDTARAAGIASVGVLWGFRAREELDDHGAGHLIERPEELLERVAGPGASP